jgi:capsular exopolysaccharide synthesis family protein
VEPREFARILQRNWALIIASVLIVGALATAYSLLKTPQYVATSKALLTTDSASSSLDLTQGTSYAQSVVKTYADVATTPYVLDPVIARLKLPDTAEQLSSRVVAAAPLEETVLQITTTDSSPRAAADISNTVMSQLGNSVVTLAPDSANRSASVRLTLLQKAVAPTAPISPNVPLNTALGLVLGLVLGLLVGFARNRFDTGISTARDVSLITDFPALGSVGFRRGARRSPIVTDTHRSYARVEEFKALRSEILRANPTRRPMSIMVAASTSGEGASTTAANLAVALAGTDRRVLLVDANLRHPTAAALLGVEGTVGLSDVLGGGVDPEHAIRATDRDGLSVLSAGARTDTPGRLLDPLTLETLIADLNRRFDVVLIDAPPLLANDEALRIGRVVDGVVVIAASGRADRVRLQRALQDLDESGAWVLGVVVTMATGSSTGDRRRRDAKIDQENQVRALPVSETASLSDTRTPSAQSS